MNLTLSLVGVACLSLVFAWITGRAWRIRRFWLRWPSVIIAGLITLVCLLAVALPLRGLYRLHWPSASPAPDLQIAGTPEQRIRGEHLAYLCVQCHSSTGELPLDGAAHDLTEGAVGTLYPTNLTPGGPLRDWTDGEIVRAIREGIHQNGRTLLLMPSEQYHAMSDEDVQALVIYLRSQPAIERQTPEMQLNLLGAAIVGAGIFPISRQTPIREAVVAPPSAPTVEYGAYLVKLSGCSECHGDGLRGGTNQFTPIGPNLPAIIGQWERAQFIATMRTGMDPYGHQLDPDRMPWRSYAAAFTDDELTAMDAYIRSLPPAGP